MDVHLYEIVLSYRRGQRLSNRVEYGYNEAQLALRQDFSAGRLIWYEDWLQDWWCFLRNTHPFFAAFASHELHVVGKIERYWIYAMLICAYWLMAALAVETRECVLEPTCDPERIGALSESFFRHVLLTVDVGGGGGGAQPAPHDGGALHAALGGVLNGSAVLPVMRLDEAAFDALGGARYAGHTAPDAYMCCLVTDLGLVQAYGLFGKGFVSLVFAVLTVVVGQTWFLLAACGCCQFARPAVRYRWERVSTALLFAFGVSVAAAFVVAYSYMSREGLLGAAWLTFGLVKAASISGAFVLQTILFAALYRKQRAMSGAELQARFHLTTADVRECDDVRRKLGLPPLDLRFKMFNAVLPDVALSRERWRLWLGSLELRQLFSTAAWCVCSLWLAATLVAGGTMAGAYVEHHRHPYPRLHPAYPLDLASKIGVAGGLGLGALPTPAAAAGWAEPRGGLGAAARRRAPSPPSPSPPSPPPPPPLLDGVRAIADAELSDELRGVGAGSVSSILDLIRGSLDHAASSFDEQEATDQSAADAALAAELSVASDALAGLAAAARRRQAARGAK